MTPTALPGPRRHRLLEAIAAVNLVFWFANGLQEWLRRGLFPVAGVDWARFWGAARAFELTPQAAYQLPVIGAFMQPLVRYGHADGGAARVGPAPYPPIFLRLFAIFTVPPPPLGFLLWTLFNVVLALLVARRIGACFHTGSPWRAALVMLASFPLMMAFYVGQVVVLLVVCLFQAVAALERGREWQAGFWTGLLVLKPQYCWAFPVLYLFKRRRAALAGYALGAGSLAITSLAVGGIGGVRAYGHMLLAKYPAYAGGVAIDPRGMLGWRALLVNVAPQMGTRLALALVVILSVLTVATLPLIWRGPWEPRGPRFANQLTATIVVTLLVAYHSQPHGAALLMVPAGLAIARGGAPAGVRQLVIGSIAAAPLLGVASALLRGDLSLVAFGMSLALVALLAIFVRHELGRHPGNKPAADGGTRRFMSTSFRRRMINHLGGVTFAPRSGVPGNGNGGNAVHAWSLEIRQPPRRSVRSPCVAAPGGGIRDDLHRP